MSTCPICLSRVVDAQAVIDGAAAYDDTQGGHNDRHTLVLEAAEKAVRRD